MSFIISSSVLHSGRHADQSIRTKRLRGVREQVASVRTGGGRDREHVQALVRARVSRVLHQRLVHRRKEADLSLLQGEGRLEKDVLQSVSFESL